MGPIAQWSVNVLRAVLETAPDGIVVCEARGQDYPLLYANETFCRMTGYELQELVGHDLRRLQSWDREQEARGRLRAALAAGESCRSLLRNYRKDGTQFWNELLIQPLTLPVGAAPHDASGAAAASGAPGSAAPGSASPEAAARYFVGYCRDVSERERSASRRGPLMVSRQRDDRLSGLHTRAHFEELLQHDWQVGLRERRMLTILAFDINELGGYNDTFGRAAGDACIRRVAGIIGANFRRGSDVLARWEGGCIVALIRNTDPSTVRDFVSGIVQRVLDQHIHHPHGQRQKFVSISAGAASLAPSAQRAPQSLVDAALRALRRAKQDRQGSIAVAEAREIV
jgi:diguanylate cyclase (GGDEF)-like protein/PAS domain S-box-containing protein